MPTIKKYLSPTAVEAAINAKARQVHQSNPKREIGDVIRQIYFDRFLCRIFSEGEESEWVLKGGSAMLSRLPSSRRTLDIDVFRNGFDLDSSLVELRRLASIDLGDFFTFEYQSTRPIGDGDNQPYLNGCHVTFAMRLGRKRVGKLGVDLVEHHGFCQVEAPAEPMNRVQIGDLRTYPYRLYPVVNQFAEKVSAVLELVNGCESTRVKDNVDLVILAKTQHIKADVLHSAIEAEFRKRHVGWPDDFRVPNS